MEEELEVYPSFSMARNRMITSMICLMARLLSGEVYIPTL